MGNIGFSEPGALRFLPASSSRMGFILAGVVLLGFATAALSRHAPSNPSFVSGALDAREKEAKVNAEGPRYSTLFMAALEVIAAWMVASQLARFGPTLRTVSAVPIGP